MIRLIVQTQPIPSMTACGKCKRRKQITMICFLISLISGRGVFCLAALGLLDKLFAEI